MNPELWRDYPRLSVRWQHFTRITRKGRLSDKATFSVKLCSRVSETNHVATMSSKLTTRLAHGVLMLPDIPSKPTVICLVDIKSLDVFRILRTKGNIRNTHHLWDRLIWLNSSEIYAGKHYWQGTTWTPWHNYVYGNTGFTGQHQVSTTMLV